MKTARAGKLKVWVIQHHDEMTVSESATAPSVEVQKGERGKRVYGPFADKTQAETYANNLRAKTLKARTEES